MSARDERHEAWQSFDVQGARARAGLHLDEARPLAGAPIGLTFSVEIECSERLYLAVAADRARQRPAGFAFNVTLGEADVPLSDPMHALPDLGGPLGLVVVASDAPWRQPLLLNQFVAVEDSRRLIPPGERRMLHLSCTRALKLGASEAAALDPADSVRIELGLRFALERDDAAVAEIASSLAREVIDGPIEPREPALLRLLGMRSVAREQLRDLARFGQFSIAERARLALDALESVP